MFTGLIQQVCAVKTLSKGGGSAALTVDIRQQVKIGDSISINGVCLTVAKLTDALATFDLSGETLAKTNLGKLAPGSKVNVELALRVDERFGGHFVLGHTDGAATIKRIEKKVDFATITFSAPKDLLEQLIPKGSVAIDGISLTIAELNAEGFTVAVIPQTLRQTTLGKAQINQPVNVEIDIITKAVKRQLEKLTPPNGPPRLARSSAESETLPKGGSGETGLTVDGLRQQGF
jgi:riboflavin synthase